MDLGKNYFKEKNSILHNQKNQPGMFPTWVEAYTRSTTILFYHSRSLFPSRKTLIKTHLPSYKISKAKLFKGSYEVHLVGTHHGKTLSKCEITFSSRQLHILSMRQVMVNCSRLVFDAFNINSNVRRFLILGLRAWCWMDVMNNKPNRL